MKLEFKSPMTPNFALTQFGSIPIGDLSEDEFHEYIDLWTTKLSEKHFDKKKGSKKYYCFVCGAKYEEGESVMINNRGSCCCSLC